MKKIKLIAIIILIATICSGCPIPMYYGGGGGYSNSGYGSYGYNSGYGYGTYNPSYAVPVLPFYGRALGGWHHGFGGGFHGFGGGFGHGFRR